MSIIDGIGGGVRYPFLAGTGENPCDYELELVGVEQGINYGDKKEFFKAYVKVVSSSGTGALPAGSMATIKIDEDVKFGNHKKDIRNLVAAIANESEMKVNTDTVRQLLDPTNPGAGERFLARRGRFLNESKGTTFVSTRFAGLSGALPPLATPDQIAAAEVAPAPAKGGGKARR